MNDLISRQAAIDAVNTALFPKINTAKDAEKALRNLPSAHLLDPCETCLHKGKGWDEEPCDGCTGTESKYKPDNGWIPVSERLPEENQICIVTDETMRNTYEYRFCKDTYDESQGWTYLKHSIIAWMPLPEPYKEEE